MTHIDLGTTSAKRATWRETDARPLLQRIVADNPRKNDAELFKLLWEELTAGVNFREAENESYLRAIVQYWFDLTMLSLRRSRIPKRRKAASTAQQVMAVKTGIKARIAHETKLALLELLMPNGKTLGNCTGDDCRKFGGWFAAIAEKIPARQTVASALTQKDLYQIWQKNNK